MTSTGAKRTVAARAADELVLVGHSKEKPTGHEFDAFIEAMAAAQKIHGDKVRCLVLTEGGGPDDAQRKALAARVDISAMPVAVMSDAATVRFIVSAFAFLNRRIQSFAPTELPQAMAHLGLSPARLPEIRSLASAIRADLGASRVINVMLGRGG